MPHLDQHLVRLVLVLAAALALGVAFVQLAPGDDRALATVGGAPAQRADSLAFAGDPAPAQPPASAPDGQLAGDGGGGSAAPDTDPVVDTRTRGGVGCADLHDVVNVDVETAIHATPAGHRIGTLPARSAYLDTPMIAWVQDRTPDGAWGKVAVPWATPVTSSGWIRLDGMRGGTTATLAVADLSDRQLVVYRRCRPVLAVRTAIGRPGSESPTGRFWVTDRVIVPSAQRGSFGSFAFGLSTVQPNLPAGWTGGDQMAVHGTGAPGSIGQAASAGCLRVSEDALRQLKPLLLLGTPLVIQA